MCTIHGDRGIATAEAEGRQSHDIHSQEAESDGCLCSAPLYTVLTPGPGNGATRSGRVFSPQSI